MEGPGTTRRRVIIVGAGPVGCLAALSFAKQGWLVGVYEARPDIRLATQREMGHRSVNLALSARGITALEVIDPRVTTRILDDAIPMRGRMIHSVDGQQESQLYDPHGQHLNSLGRGRLSQILLDEVDTFAGVDLHFRHKLLTADFERKTATFSRPDQEPLEVPFDLCVGADGSYSLVRRQMMRAMKMDFQQEYIPHEYVELHMAPGTAADGTPMFRIDPNHLHIWPRHSFMLIALPNKDKSFTLTLYAPTEELDCLSTRAQADKWFSTHFPDAVKLIGREALLDDFQRNPRSSLISIKAYPYHYKDCAIIIGDAAHAMVPFYGQGLNCGFEDVRVLTTLLRSFRVKEAMPDKDEQIDDGLLRAFQEYSRTRHQDLVAIRDLAMQNYVEMRHAVVTPLYRLFRLLDGFFFSVAPFVHGSSLTSTLSTITFSENSARGWLPLYTMVTFRPDISYATAKMKAERQRRVVIRSGFVFALVSVGLGAVVAWRIASPFKPLRR